MLLSMTGYGRATQSFQDKSITVEVRSLNSKFTDLRLKTPQNFREKETELRRIITERTERGKVEATVEVKSAQGDESFGLNVALIRRYYQELRKLAIDMQAPQGELIPAILRLPNIVATEEGEISTEEWAAVLAALNGALDKFEQFRRAEGGAMENDLRLRIDNILKYMSELPPFEADRVDRLRERLARSLEEYLSKDRVDENRFEQEILFYLEKMDITEEKVRLEQHCKYFLEELDKRYMSKGRKLSFISQEIGREINTMGAKAYSSDIQRLVVNMKDELEKIKEQVANSV